MREDLILGLNEDILNSIVVLVAEQESVELVDKILSENLNDRKGTF